MERTKFEGIRKALRDQERKIADLHRRIGILKTKDISILIPSDVELRNGDTGNTPEIKLILNFTKVQLIKAYSDKLKKSEKELSRLLNEYKQIINE